MNDLSKDLFYLVNPFTVSDVDQILVKRMWIYLTRQLMKFLSASRRLSIPAQAVLPVIGGVLRQAQGRLRDEAIPLRHVIARE